jgi:hypothetical protein
VGTPGAAPARDDGAGWAPDAGGAAAVGATADGPDDGAARDGALDGTLDGTLVGAGAIEDERDALADGEADRVGVPETE